MKVCVYSMQQAGQGLVDRVEGAGFNMPDADLHIADDIMLNVEEALDTNLAVKTLAVDGKSREKLYRLLGFAVGEKSPSVLYFLFNGKEPSQPLEISYERRLMNNEVGPDVGFGVGGGLAVKDGGAIREFDRVVGWLRSIGWRGEVALPLAASYRATGIFLGYMPQFLSLYAEVCRLTPLGMLLWMASLSSDTCSLYDGIVLAGLASKPTNQYLQAPAPAEKHLWRVGMNRAIVTAHGVNVSQTKHRVYHTFDNLRRYDDFLEYRTDVGHRLGFVLADPEPYLSRRDQSTRTPSDDPQSQPE